MSSDLPDNLINFLDKYSWKITGRSSGECSVSHSSWDGTDTVSAQRLARAALLAPVLSGVVVEVGRAVGVVVVNVGVGAVGVVVVSVGVV